MKWKCCIPSMAMLAFVKLDWIWEEFINGTVVNPEITNGITNKIIA